MKVQTTCEHQPDEFIVSLFDAPDVIGYKDGSISNRFYDGTKGLTKEIRKRAEESEYWYCPECLEPCNFNHKD